LRRDAWALAIEALRGVETRRLNERLALMAASKQLRINDPHTIGLGHKLVLETIRRQNLIDCIINYVARHRNIWNFRPEIRAFLRLYTYRVKFAGIDSYEKAARIAGLARSIIGWRRLLDVEEFLGSLLSLNLKELYIDRSDSEKTSLRMFQPHWFVKYCFRLLGRHQAIQYFKSTLSNPPTYVRINTLKLSEKESLEKLSQEGFLLERVEGLKYTYKVINRQQPLIRTSSFKKGLFYIQDKASCLAAQIASPERDMTVLDLCSAPGAKTTYLAQQMENQGTIIAVDYSKRRMKIWKNAISRMGVDNTRPLIGDACNPLPLRKTKVDLVVLDPPCTSTGAFSRMPSAKWRLSKRSVKRMAGVQWKMLTNCADHLEEGGSLVYSTCSVTVEENEMLIERFLRLKPEFILVETQPRIGFPGLRGLTYCQRLYPHTHECNGFFVAKLAKID